MNKPKRLYDLLKYINGKDRFTAKECSDEFGVSVRTIQRDLEELSTWGVPFYTEQGRYGGYRMLNWNMLPPILFSADEAVSIYFAYQALSYYGSLPFQINIDSALKKFYLHLPDQSKAKLDRLKDTIMFGTQGYSHIQAPHLEEIADAAMKKEVSEWLYDSKNGQKKRLVVPLGIYVYAGIWYVPAYFIEKEKISLFRADRVLEVSRTGQTMNDLPTLQEWLQEDKKNGATSILKIRLTKEGVRLCKGHPILHHGLIEDRDGGWIYREIDLSEMDYTISLLLPLGKNAEVIQPEEMRNAMREHVKVLVDMYKN